MPRLQVLPFLSYQGKINRGGERQRERERETERGREGDRDRQRQRQRLSLSMYELFVDIRCEINTSDWVSVSVVCQSVGTSVNFSLSM